MDSNEGRLKIIQSEAERLKQYLNTLPPEAWSKPSACDGWEVADIVAHLTFVAEFCADVISRGVRGDVSPPRGFPGIDLPESSTLDAYIAEEALTRRKRLGEQLLPTFRARWDQFHQLMASLSPDDWGKPCWRFRWIGTYPAQQFIVLTLQELVVHGWDLRSRLEPSPSLSAECLPVLVERIAQPTFPRLSNLRMSSRQSGPVRYRFAVTGIGPSTHDIVVEEGKGRIEPAGAGAAEVTFRCDRDTFVLMMYKRLTLDEAIAAGRLSAEGDSGLISDFDRWSKGA